MWMLLMSGNVLWRDWEWDTWSLVLFSQDFGWLPAVFIMSSSVQDAHRECKPLGSNTTQRHRDHWIEISFLVRLMSAAIDKNNLRPLEPPLPWQCSLRPSRKQVPQPSLTVPLGGGSSSYFPLYHKYSRGECKTADKLEEVQCIRLEKTRNKKENSCIRGENFTSKVMRKRITLSTTPFHPLNVILALFWGLKLHVVVFLLSL